MDKLQRSRAVREMLKSDTFQSVLKEVRDAQVAAFLNAETSQEALAEAHVMVRALGEVEGAFKRIAFEADKVDKEQHRGND